MGKTTYTYICESQNQIRDYFLAGNYTHLFFLETDLFPPRDIVRLFKTVNAPVISAPYFLYYHREKMQMNQEIKIIGGQRAITRNYTLKESFNFTDGRIKEGFAFGFGCTLIRRDVVEKIPFRVVGENLTCNEDGSPSHADSFFYSDLQKNHISPYLYTGITVVHHKSEGVWLKVKQEEKLNKMNN